MVNPDQDWTEKLNTDIAEFKAMINKSILDFILDLGHLTPKSQAKFINNIDIKTVPKKPLCFSAPYSLGDASIMAPAAIIKDAPKAEALLAVLSSSLIRSNTDLGAGDKS